jgi:hypothetical protein
LGIHQVFKVYDFTHVTSSPRYPQSNSEAKRAVRSIKDLRRKSDDPFLALLAHRSTPLKNGFSPAELLMPWITTTLPMVPAADPTDTDYDLVARREEQSKEKTNFEKRHQVRVKDPLETGDRV